jgi:hypothetical protein
MLFGLGLILGLGCGGGASQGGPEPPSLTLRVQPSAVEVPGEESQFFQALVTGGPDPGVTWSVVEGPAGGTITAEGLYTAPPTPGGFHVLATAKGQPAATAQATVKVIGKVAVAVSPATANLLTGGTQPFVANLQNATDARVSWSVTGGTITPDGLFAAPTAPGIYLVKATSVQYPNRFATATAIVTAPLKVPAIASFTATPASVLAGQHTTLGWNVTGADAISISSLGTVTGNSVSVSPAATTTYTLTATNAAGSTTASATVTVNPAPQPPAISSFTATPAILTAGQSATLAWNVVRADALSISGLGTVTGTSVSVSPAATTTYTLTATNAAGSTTAYATVTVIPAPQPPAISSFTATPATLTEGHSTTLAWNVVRADAISISGIGTVTGTSLPVSPSATTIYTLTATNAAGSTTADATVTVNPAPEPPVIARFTATPESITSGQSSVLSWEVAGATALTISPFIGPVVGSSVSVSPSVTTLYTLTAGNAAGSHTATATLTVNPQQGPPAGNPNGHFPVPLDAQAEDVSSPTQVIGTGTPESCTAEAFIQAVARGGTITFNGGPNPFTITLDRPAKVFNNKPDVVIDGGGLVTISGGGTTRILYMNTCDPNQVWTTSHCQDQDHPRLTVQNLTFIDGNSKNETLYDGGGAIWVRGGRFKVVNCRFFNNVCASLGPDVGGGAIRVFSQYHGLPVYVVNSTFGGASGFGNVGANGGGISSIGVSWSIYNSLFSYNQAVGNGGNPAQAGTPGGGSGGAIYNDGNTMTLALFGTLIEFNSVNAYGSAIFFVTNDHTGTLHIEDSVSWKNIGGSWYTLPGISMHSDTKREIINSVIE